MPPSRRVLVTGASGFVGRRIAQRWPNSVLWPKVDLCRRPEVENSVSALLRESPFDSILHLAAISSVWNSFNDPVRMFEVNTMGTVHLLQALTLNGWRGRFLFVSSGAVYGDPDSVTNPLLEASPLAPSSPYAASKAAAEHAVLEWGKRSGGDAVVVRPSNHAGAGQSSHFFLSSMARQITSVSRGQKVVVETGNLTPYRDFLHVDDVVDGYQALLERAVPDRAYNLASGKALPLSEILRGLADASGREVETRIRSERFRAEPSRPLEISIERIQRDTDWSPQRGLEHLYCDLITFWETKHAENGADHWDFGSRRGLP